MSADQSAAQWAASRGWDPAARLEHVHAVLSRLPRGRLLDLGAGHGKFSVMAADLGWEVTAVDARGDRFPTDDRITWIVDDVRTFPIGDDYDLVLNLGLLYHLPLQEQLDLLRATSSTLTLVDTHAAVTAKVDVEGWQGAWFDERLEASTASVGNTQSFWPIESELQRQFRTAGYGSIWRLTPESQVGRTMWLCFPADPDSLIASGEVEPSRHEIAAQLRAATATIGRLEREGTELARRAADASANRAAAERLARLEANPVIRTLLKLRRATSRLR